MNRAEAPRLTTIETISFVEPEVRTIKGNVKLYHMPNVPNETARFDLYFDAGKIRGEKSLASFVNGLLLSGTPTKSAVEIQEEINALGGYLDTGLSAENSVFSVYCLRENLEALFNLIIEVISEVAFFEDEVSDLISDRRQKLQINLEKVSYLAQSNFQKQLFASDPRYTQIPEFEHFEGVSIEKLKKFHREYYLKGLQRVVVIGNLEDSVIDRILSKSQSLAATNEGEFASELQNATGRIDVPKEDAVQSAIRVGRILFNKKHPDYLEFLILNTILGDYFGSRLMSNIREDKGYTYGIGTMVAEFQNTGYFLVATEVGSTVRDAALKEIKYEFERLQNELVSEMELDLVRNYMRGQLLKSADGPYAMTDLFLSAELQGKDIQFYNDALLVINHITPARIQELAKQYLNWDDMSIVTAG